MAMTPRPFYSENIKPAVVYRVIDRGGKDRVKPTVFLDELDTYRLLATGYRLPATGYRLLATGYWLPSFA